MNDLESKAIRFDRAARTTFALIEALHALALRTRKGEGFDFDEGDVLLSAASATLRHFGKLLELLPEGASEDVSTEIVYLRAQFWLLEIELAARCEREDHTMPHWAVELLAEIAVRLADIVQPESSNVSG